MKLNWPPAAKSSLIIARGDIGGTGARATESSVKQWSAGFLEEPREYVEAPAQYLAAPNAPGGTSTLRLNWAATARSA